MSYFDVLSSDSNGSYSRKLARITDLYTAVYWSQILEIVPKVVKKKKFDSQGYFKIDRNYIEERTTIDVDTQLQCESILERLDVLERHELDANLIRVDLENMEKILVDDGVKKLDLPKKIKPTRAQKSADKKASIIITMKHCLSETDPELLPLYESWVESVYGSGRGYAFLTKQKIQTFEDAINSFTKDKQIKIKLLQIAIQTGYSDPTWVINKLNNKPPQKSNATMPEQKNAVGLNTEFDF